MTPSNPLRTTNLGRLSSVVGRPFSVVQNKTTDHRPPTTGGQAAGSESPTSVVRRLSSVVFIAFFLLTLVANVDVATAQIGQSGRQLNYSQQFRLGERIIRIAEPGQLADTVNVWGDVNSPGRYLIPQSTSLPELISYSFGPQTIRSRESELDWSKMRVEVNISEYSPDQGQDIVKQFRYKFNEPLPEGMRNFQLENDQVVAVQVKRRPAFIDYVRVIAPVISSVATSIIIIDRLR